ncbi:MATH domain and coiled-coil domain-containing protein [Populus alba x Populus x berolinensis]|nr:MATH domain and coiled-coil domain-containing protein [Populus alba x Populus x berolinensis]
MRKKELTEEEKGAMEKVALDTVREERHVAPAHYTMKIDSFSLLSDMVAKSYLEQYESREFEASGYKWKLVLYPNGNKSRNGDGYISLYLVIADTTGFPPGWEINVIFNLFVYDQIQDKYLTIGDGRLRRFCAIKNQWGFPQVLPLNTFNNASNGYLIDDSCVFGAEVFVIKSEGKGEHFSMIKDPSDGTFTWEVEYFSGLTEEFYYSKVYLAGGHKWKLKLFPKGDIKQRGKFLSLFLELDDCTKYHTGWKLFVEFTLRIKDQVQSQHHEQTIHKWFSASVKNWGLPSFKSLTDIKNPSNNFIVNNTLIVEGVLHRLSVLKHLA